MKIRSILILMAFSALFFACAESPYHQVTAEYEAGDQTLILDVPVKRQASGPCCGSACLAMVLSYWGLDPAAVSAVAGGPCPKEGYSGGELADLARSVGYTARVYTSSFEDLEAQVVATRPVIVMLGGEGRRHFLVVVGLSRDRSRVIMNDPTSGRVFLETADFRERWRISANFALLVLPKAG